MNVTKIIKATAVRGRTSTAAPIIKEDYGLYLLIGGIDLPEVYEVDFSNDEHAGTSVTMIGNADGVLIPTQFIKSGKDVFAFYYHVGEDFGRTLYTIRIPNKLRPDRTDEEPTPEEQSVIDQAISALNTAVAKTAQDVISADQSARSAEQSAQNAHTYALSANTASDTAENFADAASSYASQAEQAKDTAEVYVGTAKGYAEQADASATASANSALASAQRANASADSATQAQGYANSASSSAQSASTSASAALTYANTASSKASEASTSAQTASTKATEASQSAENAQTYVTQARQAKAGAETAQTFAENARDDAETARDEAVTAKENAEQAKADAETARDEAQQAVASISGALADKAPIITDTASGAIASFSDGADNLPLKSLVVDINPIQDLSHGDPSPENICPISGWDAIGVEHSGKNLLDSATVFASLGFTHEDDGSWSRENIAGISNAQVWKNPGFVSQISIIFTAKYASDTSTGIRFKFKYTDGTFGNLYLTPSLTYKNYTFVSNPNRVVSAVLIDYGSNNIKTWLKDVQFEVSSAATPYSPYTGRSITINLGQTVYGAKLYPLEGKAVIDRGYKLFNGSEAWSYTASVSANTDRGLHLGSYITGKGNLPITSNYLRSVADQSVPWSGYINNNGVLLVMFPKGTFASATEWKAYLANNPLTVVYPLATPIEIQLSANQINSLYGVNNIWADSGDTEAVYRADTKAYIAKKIAEAISALS